MSSSAPPPRSGVRSDPASGAGNELSGAPRIDDPGPRSGRGLPGIHRNVVALGFISLFTDVSTEMILPVLPLFVTGVLGASAASLGLIEGVAESASSLLRIVSGRLSDRIGRRKPFLLFGYGISGVAKALMAFAGSWPTVLALRFSDRIGKGLRNPPRDALIADSVEPRYLGRAFGFHRAMDTIGAAAGPLVAYAMLSAYPGQFRRLFLVSAIPAAIAVLILAIFVRAVRHPPRVESQSWGGELRAMGPAFARFLVVTGIFSLAASSLAFLLLRSSQLGFTAAQVSLIYLGYNIVSALLSWPIGEISDRVGRRAILLAAYLLFAAIYALLGGFAARTLVATAFVVLGVHTALLEGSQRALLADLVPADRRATAFGIYYAVVGLAVLPANAAAGWLWDRFGARVTFGLEAALALLAALLFAFLLPSTRELSERHHAHAA